MTNAELVKLYRYVARDGDSVDDIALNALQVAADRLNRVVYDEANEHIAETTGLPIPSASDWRQMVTLGQTPWVFCHACGEITTALDGPLNTPCACWDDPPPDCEDY